MIMFVPCKAEDWTPYQAVITRLYTEDNRTIEDVKKIMETVHSFKASKHMYIDKFKIWHITKQYRAADIDKINEMIQKAELKGHPLNQITLRGRPVDLKKLSRHLLRREKNGNTFDRKKPKVQDCTPHCSAAVGPGHGWREETKLGEPKPPDSTPRSPLTPPSSQSSGVASPETSAPEIRSAISLTSPSRPMPSGQNGIVLENILLNIRIFLDAETSRPPSVIDNSSLAVPSNAHKDGLYSAICSCAAPGKPTLFSNISMATYYLKSNSTHLAFPLLDRTCEEACKAMPPADQNFLIGLLATLSPANTRRHPEVRRKLLEYLSELCIYSYGRNHPLTFVCRNLQLDCAEAVEVSTCSLVYLLDRMGERRDFVPGEKCRVQRALTSHHRRSNDLGSAEKLCNRVIEDCKMTFGGYSEQACQAMMELVYVYTYQGRYDKGLELCSEVLRYRKVRLGTKYPDCRSSFAMENMAELYHFKGCIEGCISWLRLALRSAWDIRGGVDTTIHVREKLEGMLLAQGLFGEAQLLSYLYPANA